MFKSTRKHTNWLKYKVFSLSQFIKGKTAYYITKKFKFNHGATILDINDINKSKDTVFIMGSGYSINDISKGEWNHIRETGDIFGFNDFFRGKFIPVTFHLARELESYYTPLLDVKNKIRSYFDEMLKNPYYYNTIFFIKHDGQHQSFGTTLAVFFLKIFNNRKVCLYKNIPHEMKMIMPSNDINSIAHCSATIFDVINIAYLLGYKKIILVGIDLYDRRYFWLGENETRDYYGNPVKGMTHRDIKGTYKDMHNSAGTVLKTIPFWRDYLEGKGVELYVYNPKSLLQTEGVLPLYRRCLL